MKNVLLSYMDQRFEEKMEPRKTPPAGEHPVITLSRQYGCPTHEIVNELQNKFSGQKWRVISKEILLESSKELDLKPEKLEYVFKFERKSLMDEILDALSSKYYKSDKKIRRTIKEVIHSIASQGHVIIVGRGGAAITQDFKQVLHVRLQAPLYWRAHKVSENESISFEEAEKKAVEMDQKRKALMDEFMNKETDESIFDIVLNCRTLGPAQIADIIIQTMKIQGYIA